ncbi:uncharacterized protein LOC121982989 [Zingiber officinale]|nr:uncharacterized protein LOC121982989 [Zingiber officinale]
MESLVNRSSLAVGRGPASPEDVDVDVDADANCHLAYVAVGHGPASPEDVDVDADADCHLAYVAVEVPAVGWGLGYRVYDREESTKGASNPKYNAKSRPFTSSSLNVPSKSKPPIIALPRAKVQEASAYDGRSVRRPTQCRFFPKDKMKKRPTAREAEPGSPKVSCVGKVLSERERCRRRREERKERGSWATLFCCRGSGGSQGGVVESAVAAVKRRDLDNSSLKGGAAEAKTARGSSEVVLCDNVVVPKLDAMKRFSSGRRAASGVRRRRGTRKRRRRRLVDGSDE